MCDESAAISQLKWRAEIEHLSAPAELPRFLTKAFKQAEKLGTSA
jgi:hypothetical protein